MFLLVPVSSASLEKVDGFGGLVLKLGLYRTFCVFRGAPNRESPPKVLATQSLQSMYDLVEDLGLPIRALLATRGKID